jgi:metal-dependent HD superfamily phosphatase/phosphodiesterase
MIGNNDDTMTETKELTLKDIRADSRVRTYMVRANEQMKSIGYTEHGQRHAGVVSGIARTVLINLGFPERTGELAAIAGYIHDIGCVVNRVGHVEAGALMAFSILTDMGMSPSEIATVIGAIGNHEEPNGLPISPVSAAVIIADKSDVHFSRVQEPDPVKYDIHDRVNYAVQKSHLNVNSDAKLMTLELEIDTTHASVTEYFEIFVMRMVLCRRAADFLKCKFQLNINGTIL